MNILQIRISTSGKDEDFEVARTKIRGICGSDKKMRRIYGSDKKMRRICSTEKNLEFKSFAL